jgi:predicted nucleic acid-binding protein
LTLAGEIAGLDTLFLDTAPIIYYIEAHPQYGPLVKQAVELFQAGKPKALTSVITITEVLPKPVSSNNEELVKKFKTFLIRESNIRLLGISRSIAERAGRLRGKYGSLRTLDALQLAAAIEGGADAFLTNDVKLKQISEIKIIVLKDYS